MKNPVRPAPLPPCSSSRSVSLHRSTSALDDWGDGNDPFSKRAFTNRSLSVQLGQPPGEKKKPPPRPPPPKFAQKNQRKQIPARPSSLLSGIFNRNSSRATVTTSHQINSKQQKNVIKREVQTPVPIASLIDLNSPSCSPTPTTRSSSDGLSINSFGSDGSMSNNGQTPGGGSSSMFESGFEDDFDFFGGLSSSSSFGTPLSEHKDPWSVSQPQDPFSPPKQSLTITQSAPAQKKTGSSTFFTQTSTLKSTSLTTMPTIIRAKPARPPTLPKLSEVNSSGKSSGISLFPVAPPRTTGTPSPDPFRISPKREIDDDSGNWSPPMPTVPPPPLPPEALLELESEEPPPQLPPRPVFSQGDDIQEPYGIALYDYPATHPDDLSFKANDKIFILHQVNDDWLYGQRGQLQGMFPVNFIKVVVPLEDTKGKTSQQKRSPAQIVKALYPFSAETWDDLQFEEGASLYVISRIDDDWLFGECEGKSGQFPASFVDRIPSNLPQRTN